MKFLLLSLALVAVALCQTCSIERSWAQYQTDSQYVGGLWEQYELTGWGMDGGNKLAFFSFVFFFFFFFSFLWVFCLVIFFGIFFFVFFFCFFCLT